MIKFMRSAVVVVACVAGFGAWGASVSVSNGSTIYASELFGPGHGSPMYPADKTPMAKLTIPANVAANPGATPPVAAVNHSGSFEVTFSVTGGATFDANVSGLVWDSDTGTDGDDDGDATDDDFGTATSAVASIKSGGRKGDSSITIMVEEAGGEGARSAANGVIIGFDIPRLANLGALGVANSLDARTDNDQPAIYMQASVTRLVSGSFTTDTNTPLTGGYPWYIVPVIHSRDSVTVTATKSNEKTIVIDGDSAFKAVKEAKAGYVELATVTVTTKPLNPGSAVKGDPGGVVGYIKANAAADPDTTANQQIYKPAVKAVPATPYDIRGMDGLVIDAGLRGTLTMSATGTRELFNEGDMLFIDYDKNKKMGPGEEITIDGASAMGSALSIDADAAQSDSFDKGGTGAFKVYYMAGGKMDINHGAMINLVASVDYSDPSATTEAPAKASSTFNFEGVSNPVMAYAIPHSTNGTGDKGNVRVRCEQPVPGASACRVFLECWDDMGMRGFGEAPMIDVDSLSKWTGADIEGVTGLEPSTRHSCRVLSRGTVTVQQLTRDGNSGTLVNNTYVGEAD